MAPTTQNTPRSTDMNRVERQAQLRMDDKTMKDAQEFFDRAGIPANAHVVFTSPLKRDTVKASNATKEQLGEIYRWKFYDTFSKTYEGDGAKAIINKIEKEMSLPKDLTLGVPEVLRQASSEIPKDLEGQKELLEEFERETPWKAPPTVSLSMVIRGLSYYQHLSDGKGPDNRVFDWPDEGTLKSLGSEAEEAEEPRPMKEVLHIQDSFPVKRDANSTFGMIHSVYSILQMGSAESISSEGNVERQIGHRLEGYLDIPDCISQSQTNYTNPTGLSCFGSATCRPDMCSMVDPPMPGAWSMYKPIVIIAEAKKQNQNVSAQLAVACQPTLQLLVACLTKDGSWNPLDKSKLQIPSWMYIYGIGYDKDSLSIMAFFPSYKIKSAKRLDGTKYRVVEWYFNAMNVMDSTTLGRYETVFSVFEYFKRFQLLAHLLVVKNHAIALAKELRGEGKQRDGPDGIFAEKGLILPEAVEALGNRWNVLEREINEIMKAEGQKRNKAN